MKFNKILNNCINTIGIILMLLVLILNLLYITDVSHNLDELININKMKFVDILIVIFIAIEIYEISKIISKNKLNKNIKLTVLYAVLILYAILQLVWINYRNIFPVTDQGRVYATALNMYKGDYYQLFGYQYLELYPQQLTLAYIWSIIFHITQSPNFYIIQVLNVVSNILSLVMIFQITKILGKKYNVNGIYSIVIFLCFLVVPILSTFVYGDELGLALALTSVYYIMQYTNDKKKYKAIVSAIFMALSCIARLNSIIFLIAVIIYLILDLLKEKYSIKELIYKALIILTFIAITIIPMNVIKSDQQDKCKLDKERTFPTVGFLYMGMYDGQRAPRLV